MTFEDHISDIERRYKHLCGMLDDRDQRIQQYEDFIESTTPGLNIVQENIRLKQDVAQHELWAEQATTERVRLHQEVERYKTASDAREPVQWFASEIEKTLKRDDPKNMWESFSFDFLMNFLAAETAELRSLQRATATHQQIIQKCTDVAKVAMMIADLTRQHLPKEGESG